MSTTFVSIPNKNINITYGDHEFLTGVVGSDTVTVGGMTVTSQVIGLMTNAAWNGDGINTGLLGLAYPQLTAVYDGTDPNQDAPGQNTPYDPFFFTAFSENVVSNPCTFSLSSIFSRTGTQPSDIYLLDFSLR